MSRYCAWRTPTCAIRHGIFLADPPPFPTGQCKLRYSLVWVASSLPPDTSGSLLAWSLMGNASFLFCQTFEKPPVLFSHRRAFCFVSLFMGAVQVRRLF